MVVYVYIYALFIFFLSSFILFLFFNKFLKINLFIRPSICFALFLGFGPIVLSYLLYLMFLFFPHKNKFFYLGAICAIFTFLLIISFKELKIVKELLTSLKCSTKNIKNWNWWEFLYLGIIIYLLFLVFIEVIFRKDSHDFSNYLAISRIFYNQLDLSGYPFIFPHSESGFYSTQSHPPVFNMLLVFTFFLQNNTDLSFLIKMLIPLFFLFDIIAVFCLAKMRFSREISLLASVIFATIPNLIRDVSNLYIDSFTLYIFIFSIFWIIELIHNPHKLYALIISGLGFGFMTAIHSLYLFIVAPVLFISFLLTLIKIKVNLKFKIKIITFLILFTAIIGGPGYIVNYLNIGAPDALMMENKNSQTITYFQARSFLRMRGQDNWLNSIRYGRLQIFFDLDKWGFIGYLILFALYIVVRHKNFSLSNLFILSFIFIFHILIIDPFNLTNRGTGYGIWSSYRYHLPILVPGILLFITAFNSIDFTNKNIWLFNMKVNLKQPAMILFAIVLFLPANRHGFRVPVLNLLCNSKFREEFRTRGNYIEEAINNFVNIKSKNNECFFIMDPAFFVYAKRRAIFYLDPRLKNFYKAKSPLEKLNILNSLKVDYIFFSKTYKKNRYHFYREISPLINNPEYSDIVYSNIEITIYRLKFPPNNIKKIDISNKDIKIAVRKKKETRDISFIKSDIDKWILFNDCAYFLDNIFISNTMNDITITIKPKLDWRIRFLKFWYRFTGKRRFFSLRSPCFSINKNLQYKISFKIEYPSELWKKFGGDPKIKIWIGDIYGKRLTELETIYLTDNLIPVQIRYLPEPNISAIILVFDFFNIKQWIAIDNFLIEEYNINNPKLNQ